METINLSIVLPVFNPCLGWSELIVKQFRAIEVHFFNLKLELIVVNDGSTNVIFEKGKTVLETLPNCKVISYEINKGKGHALRQGVMAARASVVVYTDIDFPYSFLSFQNISTTLLQNEADVAIGVKDKNYYKQVPPFRKFISKLLRFFIRTTLRIPTDDTQCGLKGMNQKGKTIFLQTTIDRYLFDLEFVFLCAREKSLRLNTQEVFLREDVAFRKMNWRILLPEAGNFLKILWRR